ncbi:MAG: HU family DNA-binding protein [Saprospiraceae bacterium]
MQIDLAAHIEKLLFLHDTLTIPSFGGFTASKTTASVDYAGGTVAPPGKTLTFSENLVVDDGLLVDDIAKTNAITNEEAREAVRKFVEQVEQQLGQREIVTLPGVGRLYRNYVQKIQFLPDATNFHAGSYGLPPLQFSPIARSRELAEKPASDSAASTTIATTPPPPPVKTNTVVPPVPPLPAPPNFVAEPYQPPRTSASRFGTVIGIGLILCTTVFGVWWWLNNRDKSPANESVETQSGDGMDQLSAAPLPGVSELTKIAEKENANNRRPAPTETSVEEKDLNDEVDEAAEARAAEQSRRQNESPAARPEKGRECVLLIATLQDSNNADRLIAKLEGAGYDVYHRQHRGHQVGIKFTYTKQREIDAKREELVRFTGERGVFVKK